MDAKWTGGVVARRDGEQLPTVEDWRPVSVPGRSLAFADAEGPMAYRTTFADPREASWERALLELRGTYPTAEIWLNGDHIGTSDSPIVPFRVAFEPQPENQLLVVCDQPDSLEGVYASDDVPEALATPGIWWDIDVESRPKVFLRDLEARARLTEDGGVIDVECEVDAAAPVDDSITLSVRPEGFRGGAGMQRSSVEAVAGERVTVTDSLEVREPSLWWPRGYGPQHRYTVRAKLGDDTVSATVGFQRVERDDEGLLVNGRRVRLRGFTRLPGGNPERDVERAAEANATLLRARGHAPPALYEACDRAGILVWQDLPTSGPPAEMALERSRDLAAMLEETYGHHPSLGLYGITDERAAAVDGFHGTGTLTKLRVRYRLWRSAVDRGATDDLADAISEAVDRPVISSTGPPGTAPDATTLYPGWRYLEDGAIEWLLELDPAVGTVVGGFGAGSLTAEDAVPAEIPGFDEAVVPQRIGTDTDVADSQTAQARTVKTVAETLRRSESALLAAETLRDVVPGGGMGVVSHDGDAKPAFRALAQSFEPVQAVLDGPPTPGSVGITLCNDSHDECDASVSWQAGDAAGETTVTVGPLETAAVGTAEIPQDAARIELELTVGERTIHNQYPL